MSYHRHDRNEPVAHWHRMRRARLRAPLDASRPRCACPGCTRPAEFVGAYCSTTCAVLREAQKRKAATP